jgi:hypothetical protein
VVGVDSTTIDLLRTSSSKPRPPAHGLSASDIDDNSISKDVAILLPLLYSMSCRMDAYVQISRHAQGDIILTTLALALAVRRPLRALLLGEEVMAELDLDTDVVLHAHGKATPSYRRSQSRGAFD